jgi:phosphotransferase system HPr-like phosphotransfer protein
VRLGCVLSLFMPYELGSWMLGQWSGLSVSASSLWKWVQIMGTQAQQNLEAQLDAHGSGVQVACEAISEV